MKMLSSLRSRIFLASALLAVLSIGAAIYVVSARAAREAENALQREILATRALVEQLDDVVARIGGREHAFIRMAKRAHHATAQCAMPEKQDCCKSSQQ